MVRSQHAIQPPRGVATRSEVTSALIQSGPGAESNHGDPSSGHATASSYRLRPIGEGDEAHRALRAQHSVIGNLTTCHGRDCCRSASSQFASSGVACGMCRRPALEIWPGHSVPAAWTGLTCCTCRPAIRSAWCSTCTAVAVPVSGSKASPTSMQLPTPTTC
jgi:hypothetical protein